MTSSNLVQLVLKLKMTLKLASRTIPPRLRDSQDYRFHVFAVPVFVYYEETNPVPSVSMFVSSMAIDSPQEILGYSNVV